MNSELRQFAAKGYALFPLRKGAKTPRDRGWQAKTYNLPDLLQWLAAGGNIGVRLRAIDLVLDLDPRNFQPGEDPFERLSNHVGADLGYAPTVISGRGDGGRHVYFKKPADLRIVGKLKAYRGIDFRSLGSLVVAPCSLHPATGRPYLMDDFSPPISEVTQAPAALLGLLARPEPAPGEQGRVGGITNGQLRVLLAALDPTDYGAGHHDAWFSLMAAAHDATAGHGLVEWLSWCEKDGAYNNDVDHESTSRRWASLTAGKPGGAGYKSLLKAVVDAGRPDLVAALGDGADDDFPDMHDEANLLVEAERKAAIAMLRSGEAERVLEAEREAARAVLREGGAA